MSTRPCDFSPGSVTAFAARRLTSDALRSPLSTVTCSSLTANGVNRGHLALRFDAMSLRSDELERAESYGPIARKSAR